MVFCFRVSIFFVVKLRSAVAKILTGTLPSEVQCFLLLHSQLMYSYLHYNVIHYEFSSRPFYFLFTIRANYCNKHPEIWREVLVAPLTHVCLPSFLQGWALQV